MIRLFSRFVDIETPLVYHMRSGFLAPQNEKTSVIFRIRRIPAHSRSRSGMTCRKLMIISVRGKKAGESDSRCCAPSRRLQDAGRNRNGDEAAPHAQVMPGPCVSTGSSVGWKREGFILTGPWSPRIEGCCICGGYVTRERAVATPSERHAGPRKGLT